MAILPFSSVWRLVKTVEQILESDTKLKDGLARVAERLDTLERRMLEMEADRRAMITESKAAAMAAASGVSSLHTADMARQLGVLQEQVRVLRVARTSTNRQLDSATPDETDT